MSNDERNDVRACKVEGGRSLSIKVSFSLVERRPYDQLVVFDWEGERCSIGMRPVDSTPFFEA